MKFSDNERVNKFMDDLQAMSPDKLEMAESIRKIFLSANKNLPCKTGQVQETKQA